MRQFFREFFVYCLLVTATTQAFGADRDISSCRNILKEIIESRVRLTKQVKQIGEVRNQCEFGTCWLNSGITNLEHTILAETGREIELSIDYLMVHRLIDETVEYLTPPVADRSYTLKVLEGGAKRDTLHDLLDRVGVVPENVLYINPKRWATIVAEWKDYVEYNLRILRREAGGRLPVTDEDLRKALIREFSRKFQISIPTGSEPLASGVTPKNFLREVLGYKPKTRTIVVKGNPENIVDDEAVTFNEAVSLFKKLLDSKKSVDIYVTWTSAMEDTKSSLLKPLMSGAPATDSGEHGYHAVVLTGYKEVNEGEIIGFELQNSWGTNVAKEGRYYISIDDLKKILCEINYFTRP